MTVFSISLLCGIVSCAPNYSKPFNDAKGQLLFPNYSMKPANYSDPPVVSTLNGFVEGYFMRTVLNRRIYAFEGIPYAEPPTGRLQYQAPVPKGKWRGTLQAKAPSPVCLQAHALRLVGSIRGSLDCLYLNVYTPKIPAKIRGQNSKIPVIVFLHGGAYLFGTGSERGPAYLLDQDVLLVTLNYRVGVIGFLSTGDDVIPGNNGLKDQSLALKWVYENVEGFGGDPKRITLMGHSSGAASAHFHMMSDMSKKYINNAISLSGNGFNFWAFFPNYHAESQTQKFAKLVNCPLESRAFLSCLTQMDPVSIVRAQREMAVWKASNQLPIIYASAFIFVPVIEANKTGSFIVETPEEAYRHGHVKEIPWITTMTQDEGNFAGAIMEALGKALHLKKNWNDLAKYILDYRYQLSSDAEADAVTEKVNNFYFGSKSSMQVPATTFGAMTTDRFFAFGVAKSLKMHARIAPTYGYLFNYIGRLEEPLISGMEPIKWGSVGNNICQKLLY